MPSETEYQVDRMPMRHERQVYLYAKEACLYHIMEYLLVFIDAVKWIYIVLNVKDACLYHIMEYFLVFNLLGLGIQSPLIVC